MSDFVHLHTHSDYSLLDGACSISQLVNQAYKLNMPALALTDHGNLFGAVDFYQKASKKGIRPIIGCEVYVAPESRLKKKKLRGEVTSYHLILLCKDKQGYQNLMDLVSVGFLEGFYYHPRVDKQILSERSEGLIALSGCLKGEIPSLLKRGKIEKAKEIAKFYQSLFGDDFYLEIQSNGLEDQEIVNNLLIQLGKELSIPLVATNDVHYLFKEDAKAQDVLLCIQTGKTLTDNNRLKFSSSNFYFRSSSEMSELFSNLPEAITNTEEIAKKVTFTLRKKKVYLPTYQVPSGYDLDSYLRELCEQGLTKKYPNPTAKVKDRLKRELEIISSMGFSGYFLIIWDVIHYAKGKGILVGPGRGSATGSLVAYLLDITEIDPLNYDLLFERFLNPERKALPDIDIDIQDNRRGEVIDYVRKRYGEDNVAQIITFGTMAARAAIRDVGRVLGIPYAKVDKVAKLIPFNRELKTAIKESDEIKDLIDKDGEIKNLFEIAQQIEGLTRHASTHAAGVVIAPGKLTHYTPLYRTNKNEITTQYEMHSLEAIGLLKMDFLGLKTLNVIGDTLRLIKQREGKEIDLKTIPLDDKPTYQLLRRGETSGVFQLESRGMQDLVKRLSPEKFEDIIAILALYRPGPLQSGMVDDFINRKRGRSKPEYLHPKLKPILEQTYGVILYQEQVMRIASEIAGFSPGEADILRRAMGKKIRKLMDEQREKFIQGATKQGVDSSIAKRVFELMAYFSGYGFNKSHSAGYALISYRTAYLKANYPLEFMAALLTSEKDNTDKLIFYINECRRMGIQVLPPDINQSLANFTVVKNSIRFGLTAVKNVGEAAIFPILKEREKNGKFTSIFDFCKRVDLRVVNKRVMESLIKCGAFDPLPGYRSQNLAVIDQAIEQASQIQKDRRKGQLSLFENLERKEENFEGKLDELNKFPQMKEASRKLKLAWEKELLGVYLSGHPLKGYERRIAYFSTTSLANLNQIKDKRNLRIAGVISSLTLKNDRRGRAMAFLTLEDLESEGEVVIFSEVYEKCASYLKEGNLILVEGGLDASNDSVKIIANKILPFSKLKDTHYNFHLQVKKNRWGKEDMEKMKDILLSHKGELPLYLHFQGDNKERITVKSKSLRVDFSESLISEIEEFLGKNSIWIEK